MKRKTMTPLVSRQSVDDYFEEIGNRAIQEAEGVPCELEDFAAGCRSIARQLNERAALSEAEVRQKKKA